LYSLLLRKKDAIEQEKKLLPNDFEDDPQGKLLEICYKFTNDLGAYVDGARFQFQPVHQLKPLFRVLKKRIEETKPIFGTDGSEAKNGISQVAFSDNSNYYL